MWPLLQTNNSAVGEPDADADRSEAGGVQHRAGRAADVFVPARTHRTLRFREGRLAGSSPSIENLSNFRDAVVVF